MSRPREDGPGQGVRVVGVRGENFASHTDVVALNGGLGGLEAQTDILVPSAARLARASRLRLGLGVLEDVRLLLESTLRLDGQLGGHGCGWR